jgi:hypothetical protein
MKENLKIEEHQMEVPVYECMFNTFTPASYVCLLVF